MAPSEEDRNCNGERKPGPNETSTPLQAVRDSSPSFDRLQQALMLPNPLSCHWGAFEKPASPLELYQREIGAIDGKYAEQEERAPKQRLPRNESGRNQRGRTVWIRHSQQWPKLARNTFHRATVLPHGLDVHSEHRGDFEPVTQGTLLPQKRSDLRPFLWTTA